MGFKKFLIEREDEAEAQGIEDVNQKIIDYLKNIEREDITDEAIHGMADELEMEPSELEVTIYQLLKDRIDEESNEESDENHEDINLEPDEDEKPKMECNAKKDKALVVNDSTVVTSFLKKEPMSGNRLKSTGRDLYHVGESVTRIAKWQGSEFTILENFVNTEISKLVKPLRENCSYKKVIHEAKKINKKEYKYYLIRNNKIVQGFENKEDGTDLIKDDPDYAKSGKICAKSMLKSKGLDPENKSDWKE